MLQFGSDLIRLGRPRAPWVVWLDRSPWALLLQTGTIGGGSQDKDKDKDEDKTKTKTKTGYICIYCTSMLPLMMLAFSFPLSLSCHTSTSNKLDFHSCWPEERRKRRRSRRRTLLRECHRRQSYIHILQLLKWMLCR